MKQFLILFLCLTFYCSLTNGQTITGNLSQMAGQQVTLEGFNGLKTYSISNCTIDKQGDFKLAYDKADYGVGYLQSNDKKTFFVILSDEHIEIKGDALGNTKTIEVVGGRENKIFQEYALAHPKREQALSAWLYLEKLYTTDGLFSKQESTAKQIQKEKIRIKKEDLDYLKFIPNETYISWFLPTRKLINEVSVVAQYRPAEISSTIASFRKLDYTDKRLYKSGLFRDAIESHFWLIENSGLELDSIYLEMQVSIDAMLNYLVKDEKKLNEVTDYLFEMLERRSLFQVSEYLALKVLNEEGCTIDSDLARQLESYRAMKKGNVTPDFMFNSETVFPNNTSAYLPQKLSDLKSRFTVVIFGASWCPKCTEEVPEIAKAYSKWRQKGIEVVFVSLDENKEQFSQFVKDFPFISTCDFKKWDGPIVGSYYVFATPTIFLLDSNRKIIMRPIGVQQLNTWVEGF